MLLTAIVLAVFAYGVASAMLGTLLPSLQLSGSQSGTVALAQSVGLLIASIAAGPIVDTTGKKPPLVGGLFVMAACLWTLPHLSDYRAIALLLFILGLGGGVMVISANSLVSVIGAGRRAALLSFTNIFFGLGLIVTPWASTLVDGDPKRLCTLAAGLTTATFLAHVLARVPEEQRGQGGFQLAEARLMMSSHLLWLLAASHFLYVAIEVGVSNWMASFLILKGFAKDEALNIMGWRFGLGLLLGRVAAAPLLLKVKPQRVLLAATVLMSITTFWMLQSGSPTAVFCAGLAMAPMFPGAMGIVGDQFPRATATSMGLVVTIGWLGLAASSPLIGAIAGEDKSNLPQALLLFPAAAVLMVLINVALVRALSGSQRTAAQTH